MRNDVTDVCPPWMEILVNVIGYAGFIGIANWHANFARWNARAGRPSTIFWARGRETEHWPQPSGRLSGNPTHNSSQIRML